jgi:hypothetical protein
VDSKLRATLTLNCEATDGNLTEGKHALQVIDNSTNYHKETADRLKFQIRTQQERVLNDFTEILNEKAQDVISIVNQEYNPVVGGLR